MKAFSLALYRLIFLHPFLINFNYRIYLFSLRGIGILNHENKKISGEEYLLRRLSIKNPKGVIFDVGANVGEYSVLCKKLISECTLYSFEPHPKTFDRLLECSKRHNFTPVNAALDKVSGNAILFDYAGGDGSSHASLYSEVITEFHNSKSSSVETKTWSLDDFLRENKIEKINFLKIDTEGNEYPVLLGATKAIREHKIEVIQFEFSQLNIANRNFLKDFYDLLPEYNFYRLFPGTLYPLGKYDAAKCEIFLFQNIVAISKHITI
jgi:FkbM family methyltransferase